MEFDVIVRFCVRADTDHEAQRVVLGLLNENADETALVGIGIQTIQARKGRILRDMAENLENRRYTAELEAELAATKALPDAPNAYGDITDEEVIEYVTNKHGYEVARVKKAE